MTANPHRGELAVELGGRSYTLRPDFEALAAIEEQTGHSVLDLVDQIQRGKMLRLMDLAVIVAEGVKAHGRATNNPELQAWGVKGTGRMVVAEGALKVAAAVVPFLVAGITGGAVPEGNADAPAETNPSA
jgi:hypothetical protein